MNHLLLLPILLPALTAVALLLTARNRLTTHRILSVTSTVMLLIAAAGLAWQASDGAHRVYSLGDWPAPFGIVLVLDRLSALLVGLTAVVGLASLTYAVHGWDTRGKNYHALFQFQLMGLNGAFLTGDIFNLFVFFEILLIASYGLLLHGGGAERLRAGLHYVVFNLAGSTFFIVALGIVYGTTGTLNLADLARVVPTLEGPEATLLKSGAMVLLVVFSIKAAVLPLYFWLPGAYGAASAPVASLFAIMTKVGIYAILRVSTLVFGAEAGLLADLARPLLLPAGLITLIAGSIGVLAAQELRGLVSYLVIASVGTLLVGIGLFTPTALTASLYYLVHSTLIVAALFLLAELVAEQRGARADRLLPAQPVAHPGVLGALFFVTGVAAVGLPPMSGFFGKLFLLNSAIGRPDTPVVFAVVLSCGLVLVIAVSRAGSVLFWKTEEAPEALEPPAMGARLLPVMALLALSAGLVGGAGPAYGYAAATAQQLSHPDAYVRSVLVEPR